jgi:ubiquitin carboxyl-terminal hydrolase 5/13
VNWVPTKLDIPLALPASDVLTLDAHLGRGLQDGETELPDSDSGAGAAGSGGGAPALPTFNEAAMAQLEGMGFPTIRCQKALLATGNADAEVAMEWLFGHMEDPGWFRPAMSPSMSLSTPTLSTGMPI